MSCDKCKASAEKYRELKAAAESVVKNAKRRRLSDYWRVHDARMQWLKEAIEQLDRGGE